MVLYHIVFIQAIRSRVKFAVFRLAFMAGIATFAHYLNNKDFSIL